jgi:type IV secretory pathway TrbD component
MLNLFTALLLLSGDDYLKVFQADQLQTLAMLFLNLYSNGFIIAQVFYSTWLFPLGYLVFKSGFLPKILGILLMADCFGILIWFFQFFLFPNYEVITYVSFPLGFIAEFGLTLWLLIMGAKEQPSSLAQ